MPTIEQIQQHLEGAKHYAECSRARGECDRCDSWFYATGNMQAHVRAYANDVEFLLAELDELRTSNSRLTDSVDMFVSAIVDERFKKDHAAMVAELHELRTKDIEASKRLRIELETMPQTVRAIFESARVDAKSRGVPIVRALVDMVANARTVQTNRGIELDALRDECRKHLAQINVLESEKVKTVASLKTVELRSGDVFVARAGDRIKFVLTYGSNDSTLPANEPKSQDIAKFEIKTENAISANVVPDNVLARAAKWANDSADALPHPEDVRLARNVLDGTSSASKRWQHAVREFVELWREDQAPDRPHPLDSEGWYR